MIHHLTLAALAASLFVGPAEAADALAPLLWKQRAVVVFGAGGDDRRKRQLAALQAKPRLLADYQTRLVAAAEDDETLRRKCGVRDRGFAVVLVGKDGGVKETWREPVDPARIFGLINRMPMRRDEVRARR